MKRVGKGLLEEGFEDVERQPRWDGGWREQGLGGMDG